MDRNPRIAEHTSHGCWLRQHQYAPQFAAFTPVQWLIAQLVACGLSDKEIAYLVGISVSTIKAHNYKSVHSLGLVRRGQLIRYIFETQQFDPEGAQRMLAERQIRSQRNVTYLAHA